MSRDAHATIRSLISAAATERFNKLSSDIALGHVRGEDRQNWHIPDPDLDAARQDALLRARWPSIASARRCRACFRPTRNMRR